MATELITIIVGAVAAVGVGGFVSAVSNRILDRQRQEAKEEESIARELQQMAGVRSIVESSQLFFSFAQVLQQHTPKQRLRVLSVSGRSLVHDNRQTFEDLLSNGVDIDLLLLDPESQNWLYEQYPWLLEETERSVEEIESIATTTHNKQTVGDLTVNFYPHPVLEMLLFIDDEKLFLSSYLPITASGRLIYEIAPGERSLYTLYREAFSFFWEQSSKQHR